MKRREMPLWQQKILNEVEKYCEFIREVDAGILIREKANLESLPGLIVFNRLTYAGAEPQCLLSPITFLIPTSHVIKQYLQRLKIIFGTSQDEIEQRISFLVREGVSVKRIHKETGASRATIYRYTKRTDKNMENEI